jgi:hypothetical protein
VSLPRIQRRLRLLEQRSCSVLSWSHTCVSYMYLIMWYLSTCAVRRRRRLVITSGLVAIRFRRTTTVFQFDLRSGSIGIIQTRPRRVREVKQATCIFTCVVIDKTLTLLTTPLYIVQSSNSFVLCLFTYRKWPEYLQDKQ